MNVRDFYCSRCSLQFDNKPIFDMHLSIVHGERIEIKEEEVICKNEPNLDFKKDLLGEICDSDQQIVSKNASSKLFKCEICGNNFLQKSKMKQHVESVHERKKSFKCDICEKTFSKKQSMKNLFTKVHEEKKITN